jgi:hypothetical protein
VTTTLQIYQGTPVQLPGKAPDATSGDVLGPAVAVLRALNLLPDDEQSGVGEAFSGPPAGVSILEAGATAASKWWSTGGLAGIAALWGSVVGFWGHQPPDTQRMMLLCAAIATAAIALAIGYLLACDVRSRGQAMVATIEARVHIARAVMGADVAALAPPIPVSGANRNGKGKGKEDVTEGK